MPQINTPFYIPPAGANPMGTAKIRPQQGVTKGKLRLIVISGGPVFLFEDDISAQAAYDRTHAVGGRDVDFDIGASDKISSETLKESFPSLMTLASDSETIGVIQYVSES